MKGGGRPGNACPPALSPSHFDTYSSSMYFSPHRRHPVSTPPSGLSMLLCIFHALHPSDDVVLSDLLASLCLTTVFSSDLRAAPKFTSPWLSWRSSVQPPHSYACCSSSQACALAGRRTSVCMCRGKHRARCIRCCQYLKQCYVVVQEKPREH